MKNAILFSLAALFFCAAGNAQSTVDSIKAKYQLQPMPEALTLEKSFPVLGTYSLTAADGTSQSVVISMDSASKGIVWVEGLPEGKFKAYLKKAPGTYRIISQKNAEGRQVPEGTLMFDPSTNTLNVALGKKFDDADPASIFAMSGDVAADDAAGTTEVKVKSKKGGEKTKTKVLFYTATKAETATSTSTDAAKQ